MRKVCMHTDNRTSTHTYLGQTTTQRLRPTPDFCPTLPALTSLDNETRPGLDYQDRVMLWILCGFGLSLESDLGPATA